MSNLPLTRYVKIRLNPKRSTSCTPRTTSRQKSFVSQEGYWSSMGSSTSQQSWGMGATWSAAAISCQLAELFTLKNNWFYNLWHSLNYCYLKDTFLVFYLANKTPYSLLLLSGNIVCRWALWKVLWDVTNLSRYPATFRFIDYSVFFAVY